MIITCPHCNKQHRLREGFVPPHNSATSCKGCGRRFLIDTSQDAQSAKQAQIVGLTSAIVPAPDLIPENKANDDYQPASEPTDESAATAAIIDTFPGLNGLPAETLVLSGLFSPDKRGRYSGKLNQHKYKLILATAPLLIDRILTEGEKLQRITSGIAYFRFEIPYANGLLTWPLNYYALVATNHRLLFINLDYKLTRPDRYVFQVPMTDISSISRGFYGTSLIIKTESGHVWDFTTIKRALANEFSQYIQEIMLNDEEAPESETKYLPQLCPGCFQPVPEKISTCPHCLTQYKSVGKAIKKSLLFPGLGAIYLSFNSLGITEMLGYLFTWIITIILVIIGIPGGILGGGMLVLAYHLMSAFMAAKMARKGYIPELQFWEDSISTPDQ